jgi:hypothetical protein
VPLVLTDADFPSKIDGNAPKAAVGKIGDYAVVFRTVEGDGLLLVQKKNMQESIINLQETVG